MELDKPILFNHYRTIKSWTCNWCNGNFGWRLLRTTGTRWYVCKKCNVITHGLNDDED